MSIGLGQERQRNYSSSASETYGYAGSQSGDVSSSSQESVSGGASSTNQSIAFEQLFNQLYGGATKAGQTAVAGAPQLAQVAQQLFTGGSKFLENLGQDAGSQYMTDRLTGGNDLVNQQIDMLREDTGRLFSEELNPAITSRNVAGGTYGGGRQGVAQGMATEVAAREFTRGATALRVQDQAQKDSIAAQVATNSLQAANTGLGALPSLLDLSERGANAELGVYASLSQILGGPTVLSQSQSTDFARSTAQSAAEAFSRSFGENTSSSTSSAHGRGDAWNFSAALIGGGG